MSMDARLLSRVALGMAAVVLTLASAVEAASHRTQYFVVTAPTPELARQVGEAAESSRRELAMAWLGQELPAWRDVCPIQVNLARGAGGETRFEFHNGQPGRWRMIVQGPPERILDSVVPHEVLHMVFATHFGQGLPRWADEGACTTVEHLSERSKQEHLLYECLTTDRGIPFNKMFAMREYPRDMLPLYAQGYSVVRFLIAVGGKRRFVDFVGEGLRTNNWTAATRRHYGFDSLAQLQTQWLDWVRQGSREEYAASFFVRPLEQLAAEGPAAGIPPGAPTARPEVPATTTPVENVVATLEAPRTLPPSSQPPFQIVSPAATSALPTRLVPVPSTAELLAALNSSTDRPAAVTTAAPSNQPPASNLAQVTPPAGSWYALQRDEYRANHSETVTNTAVARPQPIEKAQPVLIEPSRPPGALYGTPLPGTTLTGPSPGLPGPAAATAAPAPTPSYAPGSTARQQATFVSGGRTLR